MKKLGILFSILVFACVSISVQAQDDYSKEFNQEFKVNKDAMLRLDNKFGNITCETWNNNEIAIQVIVEVHNKSQRRAEELLDKINVEFSGSNSMVSAITRIGKMRSGNNHFSIDYYVKLPASIRLDVSNKYGNVFLPTMEGSTELTVKYGDLQVNKLMSDNNEITVKYGELNADMISKARIDFGYSEMRIDEADYLDMKTSYSEVNIDKVHKMDLRTSFDDVEIDEIAVLEAKSNYSEVEIGMLAAELDIDADFGSIEIDRIASDFSYVYVEGSYTGIELSFADRAGFEAEIYTKYGDFHSKYRNELNREKLGHSSYRYYGTIGNGKGKVKVKTTFASVDID